jgi:hypothetical protein
MGLAKSASLAYGDSHRLPSSPEQRRARTYGGQHPRPTRPRRPRRKGYRMGTVQGTLGQAMPVYVGLTVLWVAVIPVLVETAAC